MRTKLVAERRTVSDKRAAGRGKYKPHHAGSAKNWRTQRNHGLHRLTVERGKEYVKTLKQVAALNTAYLGAAGPVECVNVLVAVPRAVLWGLAARYGVRRSDSVYMTAERLVSRLWGTPVTHEPTRREYLAARSGGGEVRSLANATSSPSSQRRHHMCPAVYSLTAQWREALQDDDDERMRGLQREMRLHSMDHCG